MSPEKKLMMAIFDDGEKHEINTYIEIDGKLIPIPIHYKAVGKALKCKKEMLKGRVQRFEDIEAPKELIDLTKEEIKELDKAMNILMVHTLKYQMEKEKHEA